MSTCNTKSGQYDQKVNRPISENLKGEITELFCQIKCDLGKHPNRQLPFALKHSIDYELGTAGIGYISDFGPDDSNINTVTNPKKRREFGYCFNVFTNDVDQALARLTHIFNTSPYMVGSYIISLDGPDNGVVGPSANVCREIAPVGFMFRHAVRICGDNMTQYIPAPIRPGVEL